MTVDKEVNPLFESTFKVYKHVFPNGKIYIGITSRSLNQRWQHGKRFTQEHKDKISAALKGRKRVVT